MTHLTDVIESEKEVMHAKLHPNEFLAPVFDEILTQAMTNAAMAVIEEIEEYTFKACPYEGTMVRAFTKKLKATLTKE